MPRLSLKLTLGRGTAAVLAMLAFLPLARGDVFVLESGGRISGEWLNRAAPSAAAYEVRTPSGGLLTLAKDQVREVLRQSAWETEYERQAPTFADTVADQWKLAEWCREKNLKTQRTVHLLRILDLDGNHAKARWALGFTQVSGQWVIKEEWKKSKGYELYRGRWRIAQDIELLEERRKADQAEREWVGKLKKIRAALGTERAALAGQQLAEIRDPYAVKALAQYLRNEPLRGVKVLYVDALGQIEAPSALNSLVQASLHDADVEIFYACLEKIVPRKNPGVIETYVQALRNDNNVRVNRAAIALAKFDDKTTISPLIKALITTHFVTLGGGTSSDAVSTTFANPSGGGTTPGGGAGLTAGASPTKVLPVTVQNPEVLKALVGICEGTNFNYDQRAWAGWYAQERDRIQPRSARRD